MERAGLGAQLELADGNGQVRDKRRVRGQGGAGRQAGPEPEARVAWWAGARVAWRARGADRLAGAGRIPHAKKKKGLAIERPPKEEAIRQARPFERSKRNG